MFFWLFVYLLSIFLLTESWLSGSVVTCAQESHTKNLTFSSLWRACCSFDMSPVTLQFFQTSMFSGVPVICSFCLYQDYGYCLLYYHLLFHSPITENVWGGIRSPFSTSPLICSDWANSALSLKYVPLGSSSHICRLFSSNYTKKKRNQLINSVSKFLAQDNDFPASWLVP